MNNSGIELLRSRLMAQGGSQEGRMRVQKEKSLLMALKFSEQAETVVKQDGETHRVILNKNKQKMDYNDKNVSALFSAGFKVGDIFHWVEEDSDWIIYLKEGQDAYFTGICRAAAHTLKWKDDFGVLHVEKVSVRGPVETKIVSEAKSGISFDSPNYTLYTLIQANEKTLKLKRYSKVSISGKMWEITVADSISEPGVIELQLVEDYTNKETDSDVVGSLDNECKYIPSESMSITTSLDNIKTIEKEEPYKIWVEIRKDGDLQEQLIKGVTYKLLSGSANISGDMVTAFDEGKIEIEVGIPELCYKKSYNINVLSTSLPSIDKYDIAGDDKVKSFGTSTYQIRHYVDGIETDDMSGSWSYTDNKNLFKIMDFDEKEITFKWIAGSHGELNLSYIVDNYNIASKKIKIESLI